MPGIIDDILLRHGPWQEFERNVARLLLHANWKNPKVVGRSNDGGADIIAVHPTTNQIWLIQCKHSTVSNIGTDAINQIRNAGRLYSAEQLAVVTSQPPTKSFNNELLRLKNMGLTITHLGPEQLLSIQNEIPEFSPNKPKLRDYQIEAFNKVRESIIETCKSQLVLATGLGKTVVLAEVLNDLLHDRLLGDGKILVLAHTVSLVNQLICSFWRQLSKHVPTHRLADSERPYSFEGVTFATIQSMKNLTKPPTFDLIIVDEAHHLGAPDYIETVESLNAPRIIGVTATPWRPEGHSLERWLGPVVFRMGIKEGLESGYLSNVDYRIFLDNIDWTMVKGDSRFGYSVSQLNKKLIIPTRDSRATEIIGQTFNSESRKRALIFSPSQTHANSFAADLRKHGYSAESLTSDSDHIQRFRTIALFAAGKINFLCVVDIFNEGIDVPDVDMLVFMRVTHSRRIFVQQLGRGLRIEPGKENVIVLDFAADIRRIHAALDILSPEDKSAVEHLHLTQNRIIFSNKSLGNFFYEWIADIGNIQDASDDEVVKMPIIDPEKINFPDTNL